jgi:hypothetical protein
VSIHRASLSDAESLGRPLAVSVKSMCRLLEIGNTKAWELIRLGRVKTFQVGRKRLVVFESIERLVASEEP